jgi:mannobiose 2-epimerase
MKINQKKLNYELKNNLSFWLQHSINRGTNDFYSSISVDGTPSTTQPIGSMYLSRILYGTSTASSLLSSKRYMNLAEKSFVQLQEFQNPNGGFYWAKDNSNKFLHDAENINMAQAFILYGLVTYANINPSLELDSFIDNHFNFIKKTLYDSKNGGYIDGFNENWLLVGNSTKALGTHLHLLEAFVKLYEYKKDENIIPLIEELITIISTHFITNDTYDCLHRLTPDWKPLDNEIWAGHNAECSWILCSAANTINNKKLIIQCNKLALLNCFNITKDNKYQSHVKNLMNYISTNFIAPNGEWYTEISNAGKPNSTIPIIHFWKSMYHTIRYYEMIKILVDKSLR